MRKGRLRWKGPPSPCSSSVKDQLEFPRNAASPQGGPGRAQSGYPAHPVPRETKKLLLHPMNRRICRGTRQPEAKPRFLEVLDEAPQEADRKGRRREVDSQGRTLNLAQGRLQALMPAHTLGGIYFCLNRNVLLALGTSLPVMFSTPTTLGLPQAFSAAPRATKRTLMCHKNELSHACPHQTRTRNRHQTGPCGDQKERKSTDPNRTHASMEELVSAALSLSLCRGGCGSMTV